MFKTCPRNCLSLKVRTSDEELLPVDPGVTLGLLQQADPVVHLLGSVRVAVDHAVRRDDHKRVWSVETDMFFSKKKFTSSLNTSFQGQPAISHLSGLSEAQTESIKPTSSVPCT